jgi:succinoglycan biosynthesis protein ExoA
MAPPPRRPTVSVVVPARDAAAPVVTALASIRDQDYPDIVDVTLAAYDEATRDAATGVDGIDVAVVPNPAGTTPAALNLAIAAGRGEVVVRCDAHAALPPGYISRAVETLVTTGAANVGGRQVPTGRTWFERAVAAAMTSPLGAGDARYRIGGDPGPVDTVYLGVFLRSSLEEVGGFDETLERNQDYELNWRLRQNGHVVWFDPALAVEYRPRATLGAVWSQYHQYGRWKREVVRRHPGSLRMRQLAAPALVAGLAVSTALAPRRPLAAALPGAYVAATLGAGVSAAVRSRDWAGLGVPPALWAMHLAWGSGFARGVSRRARTCL